MKPVSPIFDPDATARLYGFSGVTDYQIWHGLEPDGVAGPVTTASMVAPRCGLPDYQMARPPEEGSWPRQCLDVATSYRLQLNLGAEEIKSAWETALGLWNQSCGIKLTLIQSMGESQIWATSGPLPGSTLAWSYLPNGNCGERLEQRYDTGPTWDHDFLAKTMLHELGHALGLTHTQSQADIMYPAITGRPLSVYPSPNDIRRVVNFYGEGSPDPGPDPDPDPDPDPTGSRITVTGRDLKPGTYTLRKV